MDRAWVFESECSWKSCAGDDRIAEWLSLDKNKNQIEPFDRIPDLGHNVHCLYFDKTTDELWIGTFRNGLFCYNLKTGRYERYLPGERTRLESDAIFYRKNFVN